MKNEGMIGTPESLVNKQGWSAFHTLTGGDDNYRPTLQANFARSGYYTVQFSVAYPFVPSEFPPNFMTLAEVVWSVEGNFVRRLMSLFNGSVISGSGQGVKVTLLDYSSVPGGGPFTYNVSMQVTPNCRPSQPVPPTYQGNTDQSIAVAARRGVSPVTSIAALALAIFEVPQNAGLNALYIQCNGNQTPAVPFTLQQLQDGVSVTIQNALGTAVAAFDGSSLNTWVPLPPDAALVLVSNGTALNISVTPLYAVEG